MVTKQTQSNILLLAKWKLNPPGYKSRCTVIPLDVRVSNWDLKGGGNLVRSVVLTLATGWFQLPGIFRFLRTTYQSHSYDMVTKFVMQLWVPGTSVLKGLVQSYYHYNGLRCVHKQIPTNHTFHIYSPLCMYILVHKQHLVSFPDPQESHWGSGNETRTTLWWANIYRECKGTIVLSLQWSLLRTHTNKFPLTTHSIHVHHYSIMRQKSVHPLREALCMFTQPHNMKVWYGRSKRGMQTTHTLFHSPYILAHHSAVLVSFPDPQWDSWESGNETKCCLWTSMHILYAKTCSLNTS